MALGLPKSVHPEVREMDELRQRLDAQFNAYLNSSTPHAKLINKPPEKKDVDRMHELARQAPSRMNVVSQSLYERNRNWVYFVLTRYQEQRKVLEETGYRHRLYTPEMLGKEPMTKLGEKGGSARRALSPALEAQMRVNRKLHGLKEGEAIPAGAVTGELAPMGATAPQQADSIPKAAVAAQGPTAAIPVRTQRKVLIKRIIKKKADGTQEVVEQRTVVEVPVEDGAALVQKPVAPTAAPAPKPAAAPAAASLRPVAPSAPARPAPPAPAPARPVAAPPPDDKPPRPVDREIDDFFKKYNLK